MTALVLLAASGNVMVNPRDFDPASWHATVYPNDAWVVYGRWGERELNRAALRMGMKTHWKGDIVIGRADGRPFTLAEFIADEVPFRMPHDTCEVWDQLLSTI